jgi:hypothetical protein
MKYLFIGAHLSDEDVNGIAEPVACGAVWLSGIPIADDQPLADRDLLRSAAAVRGRLLDRATFVAIRYGFAGTSTAKCLPNAGRWKALLEANRGNVEMTLKVAAGSANVRPSRDQFTSGAEYLKALHHATNVEIDPSFREAAERAMKAVASRWINRDEKSIELAALVERSRIDEIRQAGEQLKNGFPRVPFLLSGPWPLEVFADADQ